MASAYARRRVRPAAELPVTPDAAALPAVAATDTDVELMLRVQRGDESAFAELFQRLAPRLLRFVQRMVGNPARAEELTQDVFVQVFRFRHRYRPESRFSAWLYRIATNLCLNERRRPERRLRVDLWGGRAGEEPAEEPPLPDPAAATPEEHASGHELSRRLEQAVEDLPPKQRAALLLSRADGLAYRDVATALGCSEGAVKALLFRATQTLKERLGDFL